MTTYFKTSKGRLEVLSCRPSLDLRLASALLLVNGHCDKAVLVGALRDAGLPPDSLDILEHRGYIAAEKSRPAAAGWTDSRQPGYARA